MRKEKLYIQNIPAIVWGEKSDKVFLAVHGNMSHKEDAVIQLLAEEAEFEGYQVLSFDLPEHGERAGTDTLCKVDICVSELKVMMSFAKEHWKKISLFSCSMGAYFSILAYSKEELQLALFLSPVVDMERVIHNMMSAFGVTIEQLEQEETINTPIGQKLYWDYFCYVKEHPIKKWNTKTSILYGKKDELSEWDRVKSFSERYQCKLRTLENGEHYFHTEEQLTVFKEWLKENIK
ncbi:alpha/beta hydrolase [Lachnospiraceae bacterium KM106-2]|nr:alpha/beta hydrolase [Lachnospiraceae bacterium KM106-2]